MFLVMLFQSYQCPVFRIGYYRFSLFMLSLIRVFFNFKISVYSQSDGKYASHLRILLQTLRQERLYVTHILYYGFQHYGWISSALTHSPKEILLIISPSQLTLYYSE